MPIHEAVIATTAPKEVEKVIPTRTVITRSTLKPETPIQNIDQEVTPRSESVAESTGSAESVKLSPQLSALARKEQAYRQRELALKQREKDLETRLSEADQYSQLKERIGSKDFSKAEELGLNYEEYTKYLLEKQSGEDPQTLAFKKLETEIQALKKGQEESATREYEDTVAEYKREIESLVKASSEFPRIKKLGREDAVLQLILDSWEEDSTEMTVEQASKDVEAYLADLAKNLSLDEPKAEETRKLPPPKAGSRTLNQNMAAVGTNPKTLQSLRHLSESERYAEARRRVLAKRE